MLIAGTPKHEAIKDLLAPAFSEEAKIAFLEYAEFYSDFLPIPAERISGELETQFSAAIASGQEREAATAALYYFLSAMPPKTAQLIKEAVAKGEPAELLTSLDGQTTIFEFLPPPKEAPVDRKTAKEESITHALSVIQKTDFTYLATSKVNRLQPIISSLTDAQIDVGGRGKYNAIVNVTVKTPDGKPLTPYERELQETIGHLMQTSTDPQPVFTLAQIYREFAGLDPAAGISKTALKELEETLERLSVTRVVIDCTDQKQKHNLPGLKAQYRGNALSTVAAKASFKSRTYEAYKFLDLPVFYDYSVGTNQIAKVQRQLLSATAGTTEETDGRKNSNSYIVLKRVLLKTIEHMKAEKARSGGKYECRRSYDYLFEEVLGTKEPTAKKARNMRDDIDKFLAALVEQGHIKGFTKYKNGRAFAGVEIEL